LRNTVQLGGAVARGGDVVDQRQLAVRIQQSGVRSQAVHPYALQRFGGRDQGVRHAARRQLDDEIVDGVVGSAFHDIQRQDVRAYRPKRHGQRAETARSVGELNSQQIRRHAGHCSTAVGPRHVGRGSSCRRSAARIVTRRVW
jgi:hypothetical protein